MPASTRPPHLDLQNAQERDNWEWLVRTIEEINESVASGVTLAEVEAKVAAERVRAEAAEALKQAIMPITLATTNVTMVPWNIYIFTGAHEPKLPESPSGTAPWVVVVSLTGTTTLKRQGTNTITSGGSSALTSEIVRKGWADLFAFKEGIWYKIFGMPHAAEKMFLGEWITENSVPNLALIQESVAGGEGGKIAHSTITKYNIVAGTLPLTSVFKEAEYLSNAEESVVMLGEHPVRAPSGPFANATFRVVALTAKVMVKEPEAGAHHFRKFGSSGLTEVEVPSGTTATFQYNEEKAEWIYVGD